MNAFLNLSRFTVPSTIAAIALLSTACGTESKPSVTKDATPTEHFGTVNTCSDGDTCTIKLENDLSTLKVRLIGIDAPETSHGPNEDGQPFGKEARDHINSLVKGKSVRILAIDTDRYDRTLGEMYLGKALINVGMLKEGLAVTYIWSKDDINAPTYVSAETKAQKADKGIWSLDSFESPEDYRRRLREEAGQ
jgi:micrococcal nuclease